MQLNYILVPLVGFTCCSALVAAEDVAPRNNPVAAYKLAWCNDIKWQQTVSIADFQGATPEARLNAAQAALEGKGGGVIYFPAGVYAFRDSLKLKNGIVLRGAEPNGASDARKENYALPTRFEFPRYVPRFAGEGTPTSTAFKGIYLEEPARASNCGVVNIAINRGHIHLQEGDEHQVGRNRLVFGCVLRNTAVASAEVPSATIGQHPWQRFTARHHAAIDVHTQENALIANNRLPPSGDDNFVMKDYVLLDPKRKKYVVEEGVEFDYDNRPGIYVNSYGIGAGGGNGLAGTPQSHPWGFRAGIVIRDNYIYATGRCPVSFSGDGTICSFNVIRFKPGVQRWTVTGLVGCTGSSTNDNRAVQMRGYRWTVEGNDYEVHRNLAMFGKYLINDGEGLMHEAHVNSAIKDSKIIGNKGNAYLSIYKVHGIDGLLIKDNDIRHQGKIATIFVVSNYNGKLFECRNVQIVNNVTAGQGIRIEGAPAAMNQVLNNRHVGANGKIVNLAGAIATGNENYEITSVR